MAMIGSPPTLGTTRSAVAPVLAAERVSAVAAAQARARTARRELLAGMR
jgi:hypothetical protein